MEIRKVLIVDDEPDILKMGALSLRAVGKWVVVTASSGAKAVELADLEQPDLIILDVMMPHQDGPTTLAQLRAQVSTASIPIVFLTAISRPDDVERLRALGACGVVQKPFDPMRLPALLRTLVAAIDAT